MSDVEALKRERAGYVMRGLSDRVAQVDALLAELGEKPKAPVVIETAADPLEVETAVKRGPSRPRKGA